MSVFSPFVRYARALLDRVHTAINAHIGQDQAMIALIVSASIGALAAVLLIQVGVISAVFQTALLALALAAFAWAITKVKAQDPRGDAPFLFFAYAFAAMIAGFFVLAIAFKATTLAGLVLIPIIALCALVFQHALAVRPKQRT